MKMLSLDWSSCHLNDCSNLMTGFLIGTFSGSFAVYVLFRLGSRNGGLENPPKELPEFAKKLQKDAKNEKNGLYHFTLQEWTNEDWRKRMGWVGSDYCHNPSGKAVRILDYFWNKSEQTLTGIAWFGPLCESHRGLAHGGACTTAMDDLCGHIAFLAGKPWEGATVQVNVTLKAPILIYSVLRIQGKVSVEGRKRKVVATIDDGEGKVYAVLEGLSLTGVRLSSQDEHASDEIAMRDWKLVVVSDGQYPLTISAM